MKNETIIDFKYDSAHCIAENIFCAGKVTDEIVPDDDYIRELLSFSNGKLIKYGIIDLNENLLMDFESYLPINIFNANKAFCYDFLIEESYIFDILNKRKIYAPNDLENENEKSNYLRKLMDVNLIDI